MQLLRPTHGPAAMRAGRSQRTTVNMPASISRKTRIMVYASSDSESQNTEEPSSPQQFQQDSRKRLEPLRKINGERVKNAMAVLGAIKAAVEEEAKLRKDILNEVTKVVKEDLSVACKKTPCVRTGSASGSDETDGEGSEVDDDVMDSTKK